jgi:hypothetical protein
MNVLLTRQQNDWKRHENSQHFQADIFKCRVVMPKLGWFGRCHIVHRTEEEMEKHLMDAHGVTTVEAKKQAPLCHTIGRNNRGRFWCGFCGDVVELYGGSGNPMAWHERFDHIDRHFIKEGRKVGDWVDAETDKPKRQWQEEEDAQARRRENKRRAYFDVEDEDDRPSKVPRADYVFTCVSFFAAMG